MKDEALAGSCGESGTGLDVVMREKMDGRTIAGGRERHMGKISALYCFLSSLAGVKSGNGGWQ